MGGLGEILHNRRPLDRYIILGFLVILLFSFQVHQDRKCPWNILFGYNYGNFVRGGNDFAHVYACPGQIFQQKVIHPRNFSVILWKAYDISAYGGKVLNLGGGLGIHYEDPAANPVPDFASFFRLVANHLEISQEVKVHFELGRSLVGQCGSLVTKVLYVKKGQQKQFVITDAGMTELLRPALYQAVHKIENPDSDGPHQP